MSYPIPAVAPCGTGSQRCAEKAAATRAGAVASDSLPYWQAEMAGHQNLGEGLSAQDRVLGELEAGIETLGSMLEPIMITIQLDPKIALPAAKSPPSCPQSSVLSALSARTARIGALASAVKHLIESLRI